MTRAITPDDLLAFCLVGEPQLSPDGRKLAYVAQHIDREKNEYRRQIFVMDAAPGAPTVAFTSGLKSDDNPRWSPDGRQLAFISNRSGKSQLWVMGAFGGEARQVTKFKEGISGPPVWAPDARRVAFTASIDDKGPGTEGDKEDELDLFKKYTKGVRHISRMWYKLDGEGFLDEKKSEQIFVVDLDSAEPEVRQVTKGRQPHSEPTFAPDGKSLLFVASSREDFDYAPATQDLWLLDLERPEAEPICLTPGTMVITGPLFAPDGSFIAFRGYPWQPLQGYSSTHLYLIGRDGQGLRRLDSGTDRTLSAEIIYDMPGPSCGKMAWTPDGSAVVVTASDAGSQQVAAVDVESGSVTWLTAGEHSITSWSYDQRCRKLAVAVTRPDLPSDLFLVEGPDLLQLTHVNEALLAELELAPVLHFTFPTAPGSNSFLEQHGPIEPHRADGWVMKPVGFEPGRRYPAILEIHGGPMGLYGWTFFMEFQALAAAGFAVIFTNPRGSQGYGENFCACIKEDWGNLDYLDVMAGLDAALAQFPWLDPDRLGIAGGSYGGYMTNWVIGHTDRFKAAVTMRSVVNESSSVGTSDFGFQDMDAYPARPWEDMTFYRRVSPLTYVEQIQTPLLIEHQENDLRCPIEQAEQLYSALKVLHRTVEFVRYPESSHGMSRTGKPWLRVHRLRTLLNWFGRYISGQETGPASGNV